MLVYTLKRRIQKPVKYLIWSVLRKKLTAFSRKLFSENIPSYMIFRVLNTLIHPRKENTPTKKISWSRIHFALRCFCYNCKPWCKPNQSHFEKKSFSWLFFFCNNLLLIDFWTMQSSNINTSSNINRLCVYADGKTNASLF